MNALEIRNLRKTYANGVEALKGIDLDVRSGEFFALLGPNGAGKSTLIGIVSSLVNRSGGDVRIYGKDLLSEAYEAKRYVGVVPQEFNFNVFEPVIEIIVNEAGYYGIPAREARKRAEKYLTQLDLWDKRRSVPRELSGGMKRRLMIARALVHEPRLLILDEPTAGVDIEIRRAMWQFLREINELGTTIILTTHYLEEAENLCEQVAIIDGGEIVEQGLVSDLVTRSKNHSYVFNVSTPSEDAIAGLRQDQGIVVSADGRAEVEVTETYSLKDVFSAFSKHDIEVQSMRNKFNRLEELFLKIVNK